ncbi:MAG: class I adenylate-forming enzyme family protein, partial [Planctomycetota bacterium]
RAGDRVGLSAPNSELWVAAYFGILKAGGVAVPLHADLDRTSLAGRMNDCQAAFLLAQDVDRLGGLQMAARLLALTELEPDPAAPGAAPREPDDLAAILYTSGTTGRPKGAMLTHRGLVANTRAICGYLGLCAADRVLVILPFSYIYGLTLLHTHAAAGGAVVIENQFMCVSSALDQMERGKCTGLAGVAPTFSLLLERSDIARRKLEHLRYVTHAGGPIGVELVRQLRQALPRQQLFIMYGATEAGGRLSYLEPNELEEGIGTVGRPIEGVELRVLRPDGSEADRDEEGELVARGPSIMRGYYGDPEETARVLVDGALRTGDLARRDRDGRITISGRVRDLIKVGGHRVIAGEVESAILEYPKVNEVAVIGVPDGAFGEKIAAFVAIREPSGPIDPRDLRRFLAERLPPYMRPSRIEWVSELPRNAAGKVLRGGLLRGEGGAGVAYN